MSWEIINHHSSNVLPNFSDTLAALRPRPSKLFILSMSAASGWKSWKYQKWFSNINLFVHCRTPSLVHLDKNILVSTHSNWLWSKREMLLHEHYIIPLTQVVWSHYSYSDLLRQSVRESKKTWSIQFIFWMRIYLDISSFSDLQRNFHKSQSFANVRQKALF